MDNLKFKIVYPSQIKFFNFNFKKALKMPHVKFIKSVTFVFVNKAETTLVVGLDVC